jgi:cell wall-associated NlpC family hydrolase
VKVSRSIAGRPAVAILLAALLTVAAAVTAIAPARPAGAAPVTAAPRRAEPRTERLDRRIAAAAHRLEIVVEEFNESREDLRTTLSQSRRLGGQLAPMAADLQIRQAQVGGLAADTYRRTRSGPTVALFASRTPHQFVGRLLVLNRLATQQREAVTELAEARARVAGTRRTLAALAAQQRRQQTQISAKRATVQGEMAVLRSMRRVAYGAGSRFTDTVQLPAPPYVAGPAGIAVAFAFAQLGKSYRYGSSGPNSYDCSGLTSSAWARAGVHLPHNARRQYAAVAHINRSDLRPGDLIFYYGGISHVAIYIGDGKMIHAPEFGENVRVARYDFQPIHGYGRPG